MKTLLTILILFTLQLNATTYYVSNSGNNANAGTSEGTAWQTLSKVAATSFSPGDIILFERGGVWREQLTIPSSGTLGNYITFGAYGSGARPIINGADVKTGWANVGTNLWRIVSPNTSPANTKTMVVIDGTIYTQQSSVANVNSANEYFFLDAATDSVYVYSTVDPSTLTAEVTVRPYGFVTNSGASSKKYIHITNIEFRHAGRAGVYFEGPGASTSDALDGGSKVSFCTFWANGLFGVVNYDHYDNLTVEDCTASYNGNAYYSWQADEGTFRRDTSHDQIAYTIGLSTDGHGVGGYQSDNWLVEYHVSNRDYDAIHVDCGGVAVRAIMRYNKVYDSRAGSPNTPTMGIGSLAAGGQIDIYYNLLVNGASSGFEAYSTMSDTVNFFNNTIYANATTNTDGQIYLTNAANYNFKNNLIIREYVAGEYSYVNFNASNNLSQDYNCYFMRNAGSYTIRNYWNGVTYTTMASWRTASSRDANSLNVDPLFENVASDWRIQSTSPAINAGVDVGLTQDIDGNPIVGAPDIGAYEYTVETPPIRIRGRRAVVQ